MVTYRGYKTAVLYGAETGYGAGGTVNTAIKGRIQTVTINKSNELIRTAALGEGRNEVFVGFGNFVVNWSMELDIAAFDFLQFGIGPLTGTGQTATPYYLPEADFVGYTGTSMRSFRMEVGSEDVSGTDDVETLSGCVINTIGLTMSVGDTLKCSIEGLAKTVVSSAASTTFTADTTQPWIFAQGQFKWNSTAVARVTSATININNNFDPDLGRQIGSRFTEAMEMGLRKYDWVITVKMTDTIATTLRDHFYGQANSPHLGVTDGEPTFYDIIFAFAEGAASGHRNAQILLSDCAINDISKPINIGENIVELTINGTAKKGTTETTNRPIKWWTVD